MTERAGQVQISGEADGEGSAGSLSRVAFNHDMLSGIALTGIGIFAWVRSPGWSERAWAFPNMTMVLMIVLGVYLIIKGVVRRTRETLFSSSRAVIDAAWFSASVLVFFLVIGRLGYFISTWLFIAIQSFVLSGRKQSWTLRVGIVVLAGLIAFGLDVMFSEGFNVRLPEGSWLPERAWFAG